MYLWMIAAFTAYFVKGLCGFANTLIFTTILSFGASNASISPVDLLLGYPANLILTWKNRKSLEAKVWLPLAALVLTGSIPGAILLKNVNIRAIKLVFGIVVVGLGTELLSREHVKSCLHSSRPVLAIIGIAAGVLCGLFGVGALLAAYVSRVSIAFFTYRSELYSVSCNMWKTVLFSSVDHKARIPDYNIYVLSYSSIWEALDRPSFSIWHHKYCTCWAKFSSRLYKHFSSGQRADAYNFRR